MTSYTLTVLDVTSIQGYIFGSNRVAENIGASQLVHNATTCWVRTSLPAGRHNLRDDSETSIDPSRQLELGHSLDAEVILRGGGNILILFRTEEIAKQSVGKLTRRLIEEAPGLELAAAHYEFVWDNKPIGGNEGVHRNLYQKLNQAKQQRQRSAPMLGLGVTLECRSIGQPAVGFAPSQGSDDTTLRPASAEVLAKLAHREDAYCRFERIFKDVAAGYTFRREFGALGGTEGEMSYIAVVHADGNGMGKRFEEVVKAYAQPTQNRVCLNALRALSEAVDQAGQTALKATVRRLTERFESPDADQAIKNFLQSLQYERETGKPILPFRPIVYGGDDVTFVCDGRLGLALARIYLEEWELATAADATIGAAHACAGVAVVKAHYPFVRAYELADALCAGAKHAIRAARRDNPRLDDATALDWHFATSGIGGTISQIREREYKGTAGALHLRPVGLSPGLLGPRWYYWDTFDKVTRTLQSDPCWRDRRNKVKELREVLREGPLAVEQFRRAFTLRELPELDGSRQNLQRTGWDGSHCGYFDAIEALDFYLPLTDLPRKEEG